MIQKTKEQCIDEIMKLQSILSQFGYHDYSHLLHDLGPMNIVKENFPLFEISLWELLLDWFISSDCKCEDYWKKLHKDWDFDEVRIEIAENVYHWLSQTDIISLSERIKATHQDCGCIIEGNERTKLDWNLVTQEYQFYKTLPDWYTQWSEVRSHNSIARLFRPTFCGMPM